MGPTLSHPLGTDELGRDIFPRMLWGGRISLPVGFIAVGIATLIGIMLGSRGGFPHFPGLQFSSRFLAITC